MSEDNNAPETGRTPSVADTLRSALQEQGTTITDALAEDEASGANESAEPIAAPSREAIEDAAGRLRGPDGKFVAKEGGEATATGAPEDASEAPAAAAPDATETPETPETETKIPEHWSAADKELVGKAPPELRPQLVERLKTFENAYSQKVQPVAALVKAAERHKPYLDVIGATAEQALDGLLPVHRTLRFGTAAEKTAVVQKMISDYGVTLPNGSPPASPASPASATAAAPAEDEWVDPAVRTALDRIAKVEAELNSRREADTTAQKTRQEAEVTSFANEKTEAGALAHPHFDAVTDEIVMLATAAHAAGRQPALKDLYEQAVKLNPTISAKVEAERLAAAQAKWEADAKARAEKAAADAKAKSKQAAGASKSVSGAPRGSASPVVSSTGNVREDVRAAMSSLAGRL